MSLFGFLKSSQTDDSNNTPDPSSANEQPTGSIVKGDARTYPVVEIRRVETRLDDENMQLYCYLSNRSSLHLVLDRFRLLGVDHKTGDDLRPNQDREFLAYSGPQLVSDHEHEARLDYKTDTGDYFEAVYEIRYAYQAGTKTFTVSELRLQQSIRDIYG